ncbi:molybdopterin cofactor-binding domain-containing protein [Fontivita pretiosa]|uniref:xanthine dehydrogenase family protein molybdopterin-binding subunit n=1 Tax=Fontivita pretiosa TaxID=2989684 RepID=UPI003D17586E
MTETSLTATVNQYDEPVETVWYSFEVDGVTRRCFVQALAAGLLITTVASRIQAQERAREESGGRRQGGGREAPQLILGARVHIAKDGAITVMTGKVEGGQGARAQLTQAAAEELRIPPQRVALLMADTSLVPDDGPTVGSRTTPSTLPAVRAGCAAARKLLLETAAKLWNVAPDNIAVRDGAAIHEATNRSFTYADLASSEQAVEAMKQPVPRDIELTAVQQWQVLGQSLPRPNGRDIVTGAHRYPSDLVLDGMLYGKILRPPGFGATLKSIDPGPAKAMQGVVVVQDGSLVGVAAPTTYQAKKALRAMAATAQWQTSAHPSSREIYAYLREKAAAAPPKNPFDQEIRSAARALRATYHVAYIQHVPLEPRAAVAQWDTDGGLTVWTASQRPFGVRDELARAFGMSAEKVRVIVPDFGGGFGGKHTGEAAVEAARLARAAGKPVAVRWTREEEFTWAYFRPAAVIDIEASLDASGRLTSWYFVNLNSGPAAIDTPYNTGRKRTEFVRCDAPLRHGSYRALAATANNFARECFMDELAEAAGKDPLEFRLAHLDNARLRAVLEEAAKRFDWATQHAKQERDQGQGVVSGVGLACGMEKGSYVATCAQVMVDRSQQTIRVSRVCTAFECGAITSPENLRAQVHGAIIQGLGPALSEAMEFEDGRVLNASLWKYQVPRIKDLPEMEIHLLNRPDLNSVGAGETPLIGLAPAIANAVYDATSQRIRQMPIRLAGSSVTPFGDAPSH